MYYTNQLHAPNIIKYIPFANLMIAAVGFAAGLANMTDGNILFDGASLGKRMCAVLLLLCMLICISVDAICSFDLCFICQTWYDYI